MMKKITLLMACVAFMAITTKLSAQETKVTKKIKVFEWLNAAVVDGNQVDGGLHVYATWAEAGTKLKLAQQKVGMLVTILDGTAATYRLKTKSADDLTAIAATDFDRLDGFVVADIPARDALTDLSVGIIVGVSDNGFGEESAYFYTGTGWISLSGEGSTGGFIFAGQGVPAQTNGYKDGTVGEPVALTVATDTKLGQFQVVTFSLTTGADAKPYITFPQTWNKPTFYINIDGTEYPLSDCWIVAYVAGPNGIKYQQWSADVDFLTAAVGTVKLTVR